MLAAAAGVGLDLEVSVVALQNALVGLTEDDPALPEGLEVAVTYQEWEWMCVHGVGLITAAPHEVLRYIKPQLMTHIRLGIMGSVPIEAPHHAQVMARLQDALDAWQRARVPFDPSPHPSE